MKKVIYKGFYGLFLKLSNSFNNRLLTKCKMFFGIALLVMVNSCSKEKEEEPEIMCYDVAPPQESAKTESARPSSLAEKQIDFSEIH
jgi:hypothetical protein